MQCAKLNIISVLCLISFWCRSQFTIQIEGLACKEGQLMVAVYEKADHFPSYGKGVINRIVRVEGEQPEIQLSSLVPGKTYAVAVYHDVNSNKHLDKNLLGMPVERYGFSRNARATFGPPAFESAAFVFRRHQKMTLILK
ncbi:MAG: DUF2141 domain-containing protein [Bacteroidota bacterium]